MTNHKSGAAGALLRNLPIDELFPSQLNPRKLFDHVELAELATSLKEKGVIEPLVVRPHPLAGSGGYEIIAGDRRYRAARLAGLEELPCIVQEMNDQDAAEAMLVENMQRADLSPLEEARAFQSYVSAGGAGRDVKSLAQRIGKSDDYVRERLALLDLDGEIQAKVESKELALKAARLIARVRDPEERVRLARDAASEHYSLDRIRERMGQSFIDLREAVFSLAKSTPSCEGCEDRVFRDGQLPLPILENKAKDRGFCTNVECFRAKMCGWAEAHAGRVITEKEYRELRQPMVLWDGERKRGCPGCEQNLVLVKSGRDAVRHVCADQAAHNGARRSKAQGPDAEKQKAEQKREREKKRRALESHRRALKAIEEWALEQLVGWPPDMMRLTVTALLGGYMSKPAVEYLGFDFGRDPEGGAAKLKPGDLRVVAVRALLLRRFSLEPSWSGVSEAVKFCERHSISCAAEPLTKQSAGEPSATPAKARKAARA